MNYFNSTQQQNSFGIGDTPFSSFGSSFAPTSFIDTAKNSMANAGALTAKFNLGDTPFFPSGSAFQPSSFRDSAQNMSDQLNSIMSKYGSGNGDEVSWMEKLLGGHNRMGFVPAAAQSIAGIGQMWTGMQNYKLAKDQFNFSKQAYQQNLANQIKSYNTQMEDRLRGRTSDYEGKEEDVQRELDKRKLTEQ